MPTFVGWRFDAWHMDYERKRIALVQGAQERKTQKRVDIGLNG